MEHRSKRKPLGGTQDFINMLQPDRVNRMDRVEVDEPTTEPEPHQEIENMPPYDSQGVHPSGKLVAERGRTVQHGLSRRQRMHFGYHYGTYPVESALANFERLQKAEFEKLDAKLRGVEEGVGVLGETRAKERDVYGTVELVDTGLVDSEPKHRKTDTPSGAPKPPLSKVSILALASESQLEIMTTTSAAAQRHRHNSHAKRSKRHRTTVTQDTAVDRVDVIPYRTFPDPPPRAPDPDQTEDPTESFILPQGDLTFSPSSVAERDGLPGGLGRGLITASIKSFDEMLERELTRMEKAMGEGFDGGLGLGVEEMGDGKRIVWTSAPETTVDVEVGGAVTGEARASVYAGVEFHDPVSRSPGPPDRDQGGSTTSAAVTRHPDEAVAVDAEENTAELPRVLYATPAYQIHRLASTPPRFSASSHPENPPAPGDTSSQSAHTGTSFYASNAISLVSSNENGTMSSPPRTETESPAARYAREHVRRQQHAAAMDELIGRVVSRSIEMPERDSETVPESEQAQSEQAEYAAKRTVLLVCIFLGIVLPGLWIIGGWYVLRDKTVGPAQLPVMEMRRLCRRARNEGGTGGTSGGQGAWEVPAVDTARPSSARTPAGSEGEPSDAIEEAQVVHVHRTNAFLDEFFHPSKVGAGAAGAAGEKVAAPTSLADVPLAKATPTTAQPSENDQHPLPDAVPTIQIIPASTALSNPPSAPTALGADTVSEKQTRTATSGSGPGSSVGGSFETASKTRDLCTPAGSGDTVRWAQRMDGRLPFAAGSHSGVFSSSRRAWVPSSDAALYTPTSTTGAVWMSSRPAGTPGGAAGSGSALYRPGSNVLLPRDPPGCARGSPGGPKPTLRIEMPPTVSFSVPETTTEGWAVLRTGTGTVLTPYPTGLYTRTPAWVLPACPSNKVPSVNQSKVPSVNPSVNPSKVPSVNQSKVPSMKPNGHKNKLVRINRWLAILVIPVEFVVGWVIVVVLLSRG